MAEDARGLTWRSAGLGLALGLFVSSFTYFNDQVVLQTYLTGNHLPVAVFGAALALLLIVNPVLARLPARALRPLSAGEVAVVVAMGLGVCGWAGSNLSRYFTGVVAKPAVMEPNEPAWRGARVMSYLPGGSPQLAEGYVLDWPGLVRALKNEESATLRALLDAMRPIDRWRLRRLDPERATPDQRRELVHAINAVLRTPGALAPVAGEPGEAATLEAVVSANRAALDASLPGVLRPPPGGSGLLLNDGRPHPRAIDTLVSGRGGGRAWKPWELPWGVWWPTVRLWLGLALLLGLAALCLMIVVHPQWTRRELLPYPTVRFLAEASEGAAGGLPTITRSRMFWLGLGLVGGVHTLNGLHAWFDVVPAIPRHFVFSPLRDLFPGASRVYGSHGLFEPVVYFAVIGFAFFIPTAVSFSLGMSLVLWVALGAWLLTFGSTLDIGHFSAGANGNAMRFGAYVGITLMVAYIGRVYYAQVARAAAGLGGPERGGLPARAARWLAALLATAVLLLMSFGGLDLPMSVALVAMMMMMFLVLARINVETGLFYAQPDWLPGVMLVGLLGPTGVGVEAMIALTLASVVLASDPRESVAPYMANGLRIGESIGGVRLARVGSILSVMLVVGLAAAFVTTLTIQYRRGLNPLDTWSNRYLPAQTFHDAARTVTTLAARGELAEGTRVEGVEHVERADPLPGVWPWMTLGVALTIGAAAARLRLPWWPIHPVLFVVWGSYPANHFAFSFLLAALIRGAVVKLGGVAAHRVVKPMAVGLIAGDLLAMLMWSVVGAGYFFTTGAAPESYRVLP